MDDERTHHYRSKLAPPSCMARATAEADCLWLFGVTNTALLPSADSADQLFPPMVDPMPPRAEFRGSESPDFPFFFGHFDSRIFFTFGCSLRTQPLAGLPLSIIDNGAVPTFVQFVLTQELQTFINSKGVEWVA